MVSSVAFCDIAAFIGLYVDADPGADLAHPFGTLNFFDVSRFVDLSNAGCD